MGKLGERQAVQAVSNTIVRGGISKASIYLSSVSSFTYFFVYLERNLYD